MSIEVSASVVLDKPRPVVRRYLISRWVEPDKDGIVAGRVIHGASGLEIPAGSARETLAAFDEAESRVELGSGHTAKQAFEVEAHGVMWRYELQAVEPQRTALRLVYVQAGFMARVPGMRTLMEKAMRQETARLLRWAASET